MFIFTQDVHQAGGGISEGELCRPINSKAKRFEIKQHFEMHNWEAVEYANLATFCEFLETKYFKDGRKIYFQEQNNSRDFIAFSTSPNFPGEIFTIGNFKYVG